MTITYVAVAIGGIATGALLGIPFIYQIYDREIPVTVTEEKALNYLVDPGDLGRIQFRFYRTKSCFTRAYAEWKDASNRRFPLPMREWPTGILPLGDDIAVLDVPIPKEVSYGPLRYESVNAYGCNWLSRNYWPIIAAPRIVDFWVQRDQ